MALEAVMVLPILLFVTALAAEFFVTAQRRVAVEKAAYAAARSALVHLCPLPSLGTPFELITGATAAPCVDQPDRWDHAARWALISAAPGSRHAVNRGACETVPAAERAIQQAGLRGDLTQAMRNRICYAFEPENVGVQVAWRVSPFDFIGALEGPVSHAIEANVTFRYPAATPLARFIADGQRGDGSYWIEKSARVVIR
ncbi:hypothetical protein [Actibacterium mucosum]|uniref:hypothetical protein n=1 Tax=Actibacterium mucosum TaxID=1087332 RepID=UPI001379107C|nr:hypothetical protein [Actibacterium mucosum]